MGYKLPFKRKKPLAEADVASEPQIITTPSHSVPEFFTDHQIIQPEQKLQQLEQEEKVPFIWRPFVLTIVLLRALVLSSIYTALILFLGNENTGEGGLSTVLKAMWTLIFVLLMGFYIVEGWRLWR